MKTFTGFINKHEIAYALPDLLGNLKNIQLLILHPSELVFFKDYFRFLDFLLASLVTD
ncbi:MAG: hypothetical protein GY823_08720 [Flavobacteriaceae bacterium]|nr:hypothetical protein [Flavobacteriaceae bacterium]